MLPVVQSRQKVLGVNWKRVIKMTLENSAVQFHHLCEGSTISSEAIVIKKADGAYLWDIQGKRYLDLF